MVTLEQFVERFGDPSSYLFNGTYYDTGIAAKQSCNVCSRTIRYCYIVKRSPLSPLPSSKITLGSCCFHYFEADKKTHQALQDAQGVIVHRAEAVALEIKFYSRRADVKTRMQQWQQIRHKALSQLRQYRKTTGKEWLPEPLFELSVAVGQEPPTYKRTTSAIHWYETQAKRLEEQIEKFQRE